MKYQIISEKYGVASCKVKEIPDWISQYGKVEDTAFFYCCENDLIVLNEENVNYEYYRDIISTYLEFNDEQKKKFKEGVDNISIRAHMMIIRLNYMLRIRRNLYRSMMRKAGAL